MKSTAARRAVLRWGWRLFRAEWRQQILVLALLSVAVTAATLGAAFAYNMSPDGTSEFGSADQRIKFVGSAATAADIAAAESYFGTIDVITTRSVRVPGSAQPIELRAQDPDGAYGAPMLALREGRYPTGADEVAVTDSVAQTMKVGAGGTLTLEGRSRNVVGLVENPGDLDAEFALVPPQHAGPPELVSILVSGSRSRVDDFRRTMTSEGNVLRDSPVNDKALAAVATFTMAAVGMLLVALIAAAGFVVMAQRRLRELGMLAAIGATERHVRLVTLLNGTLVGMIAALIGTTTGLLAWAVTSGRVEEAAGHRINGLSVPWWLVATSILLAVVTATGAAWWPARAVARIPIMLALSKRPPRPKPAHRSAALAMVLIAVGLTCFSLSDQKTGPTQSEVKLNALLIIAGTLATLIGVLLIAPLAIRAAARFATRLPISGRLALRDLGRYAARSGAALAAITMALGVPVAVVVVASASEHTAADGNLSDRQLLIRVGDAPEPFVVPERSPAEIEALDARIDQFAGTLGGASVMALDMAVDPDRPAEPGLVEAGEQQAVELVRRRPGTDLLDGLLLYVATPQLLDSFNAGSGVIDSHDVFAAGEGEFIFPDKGRDLTPVTSVAKIDSTAYSSVPGTFISPAAVRSRGWQTVRAGWFIESASALTGEQRAAARDLAIDAGLTVETRDEQASLSNLRTGATAAGMLLAFGVLAMTVGLIRSEAAGDLRTLAATGASSTVRRNLTAATAGVLALLGVLLGTGGAYLLLMGAYLGHLGDLSRVPLVHLAAIAVGVPLLATAAGWLLAGREPPALGRAALE